MYFLKELKNPILFWAKLREIYISRRTQMVLIPDFERGRLLAKENGFDESRIACVPNGPMGRPKFVTPDFLQHRLSLSSNTRLVLHAGMISEGLMSLDIAQSAASWPDPYRLVFHERMSRSPYEPYLQKVVAAGANRVLLSLEPVPYDQLDSIYASAWVGLAFYNDKMGKNFTQCAAASGKLAFYLRNGVPVVVCSQPDLKQLIDQTGCGIAVDHPSELIDAFKAIEEDYDGFRKRARACFDKRFDFKPAFESALARLEAIN
jgi:glycosyltransferase involved in cell wall biosynthesis